MSAAPLADVSLPEIARAARLLWVRSRREATGLFAGSYASAFRGGGFEFEESRPYAPGDEVAALDWNATARTGELWVKRFREERSQTVLLLLDVSASMRFGSTGRSKAAVAAHAAALLAAAAGRAGDRVGFVSFDETSRVTVAPGRGAAHAWRVIRAAAAAAATGGSATRLDASVDWVRRQARRRATVVVLSDFRDEALFGPGARDLERRGRLAALARRHDLVAAVLEDPRERSLPATGTLRLVDPEQPRRHLLVRSGRARVRERYAAAARRRRQALERHLREHGIDPVWIPTEVDPLIPLLRFFQERAAGARRAR